MMRGEHLEWTITYDIAQTPLCQKMHHDIEKMYEVIMTLKINKVEMVVEDLLSSTEVIEASIVALQGCQGNCLS
jgi:hypothetical protein